MTATTNSRADLADDRDNAMASHSRVDLIAAEVAARELVRALGMDLTNPGLARTPERIARAYAELLTPTEFALTTFDNTDCYDEMVVATDIPFTSICEHHLLPFTGQATVGYLPGERIVGLSKLARVVDAFARRPQVQERMTSQIANWLDNLLQPRGVGVVLTAEHTCMTIRGIRATSSRTITSAHTGLIRTDARTRGEFLTLSTQR